MAGGDVEFAPFQQPGIGRTSSTARLEVLDPLRHGNPMGMTHCPLCVGLALLSVFRSSAHALLIWSVRRSPSTPAAQQNSSKRVQHQAIPVPSIA
jgi:hypothetical protein